MDTISKISIKIIKEQELVIGPLAWYEASKVSGLIIDPSHESVSFSGDGKEVINKLVAQYEKIFGQVSLTVCQEAVRELIANMSADEVPSSLR